MAKKATSIEGRLGKIERDLAELREVVFALEERLDKDEFVDDLKAHVARLEAAGKEVRHGTR